MVAKPNRGSSYYAKIERLEKSPAFHAAVKKITNCDVLKEVERESEIETSRSRSRSLTTDTEPRTDATARSCRARDLSPPLCFSSLDSSASSASLSYFSNSLTIETPPIWTPALLVLTPSAPDKESRGDGRTTTGDTGACGKGGRTAEPLPRSSSGWIVPFEVIPTVCVGSPGAFP
jgi:hypothetical protein